MYLKSDLALTQKKVSVPIIGFRLKLKKKFVYLKQVSVPKIGSRLKLKKFVYLKSGPALKKLVYLKSGSGQRRLMNKDIVDETLNEQKYRMLEKLVYLKSGLAEIAPM